MTKSLATVLFEACENNASRVCLRRGPDEIWHYHQVHALARRIAAELLRRGAMPGDRVLVQIEKSPQAVCIYLACVYAGLVYVPLNTAYTQAELAYFVEDADPVFVIRDSSAALKAGVRLLLTEEIVSRSEAAPELERPHAGDAQAPAALLYTSGTTGRSKGALLSNRNLLSNAEALRSVWGWQDQDVLLHALPIYHVHGLFVALHCAFFGGSEVRFLPRFDVAQVLAALPGSTVMMGVPTHYSRLLEAEAFNEQVCRGMRLLVSGSAPMTPQLHDLVEARTGHRVLERYGLSEGGILTSNPLKGERIAGTVGFALPGVSLRISKEGNDETSQHSDIGEVEAGGPGIFLGYFRNPEATAGAFTPDGYLKTGDLGSMDGEGRLTISGRSRDLIISGGMNIYPKEIEMCIDALPQIHESAVIGVPHPDFGEAVVAIVSASKTIEINQLRESLATNLARFKLPKKIIHVKELPRNQMGKVQKAELRKQHQHLFCEGGDALP